VQTGLDPDQHGCVAILDAIAISNPIAL